MKQRLFVSLFLMIVGSGCESCKDYKGSVILDKEGKSVHIKKLPRYLGEKIWKVPSEKVKALEKEVLSYSKKNKKDFYAIAKTYYRQHVGFYNDRGERVLYSFYLCSLQSVMSLRDEFYSELISAEGGGDCYWKVFYNTDKKNIRIFKNAPE